MKNKDIKHALANLFVKILFILIATTMKNEINVFKKLSGNVIFNNIIDICIRYKHKLFPLVICLLCLKFFFYKIRVIF